MGKTFRPYDPDQLLVLPPSVREWLPPEHLVYFVGDLVDSLDLSRIHDSYEEERGYPPYHPLLMTKLILYGYAVGAQLKEDPAGMPGRRGVPDPLRGGGAGFPHDRGLPQTAP